MKRILLPITLAGSLLLGAKSLRAADAPVTNAAPATNAMPTTNTVMDAAEPDDATPQPPDDNAPTASAGTNADSAPLPATVPLPAAPLAPAAPVIPMSSVAPFTPVPPSAPVPASPRASAPILARMGNMTNAAMATDTNDAPLLPNGEKGLRMNFRGVPLETVLNYMSDAAGFIIHPKVDIRGKVDVWSARPLNSEEAVKLLKQILNENGYTAIQDDRTLTILRSDEAKKSDIPVKSGNNPEIIPRNAEIVTQIIPVRSLNVVQLVKDLEPLRSADATITADESANSLIMTDTQANIRRITQIVKALDSVTSSSATIKVFPLVYADSKALASLIKDLFTSTDSASRTGNNAGGNNNPFGGFGRFGGGGPGGNNGGRTDGSSENGKTPTAKITAVSDDHSNSLIVSAPDEVIGTISNLVRSVDTPVEETTEVKVFHLKNADPVEMADLITSLFPDGNSTDATRTQSRFTGFGGFGGFGAGAQNTTTTSSDRAKKMAQVIAVADRRTASLVVTAGKDVMVGVAAMIAELDSHKDRKQSAHIIPLANADPIDVQSILQDLFQPSTSGGSSRSSSSQNSSTSNPLLNRQTTLLQQQNSSSSSTIGGSSGSSSANRN